MSRVINKEIEQVAIDLLKHHPRNANNGDVEAIKKSLAVNGWYGSVVVNTGTKHILAGNHRVMAAKALGWETVPVQWVDVTPEEELRILVVDNRTTRIGQDDTTKITDILAELANTPIGLDGTGYGAADLDALIDELAGMTEPAELLTDPDEVPEDVETRCKPGDLWILGRHRLLCGDSTKADDMARLMDGNTIDAVVTDPPYGMNAVKNSGVLKDKYKDIVGDESIDVALKAIDLWLSKGKQVWWGANYYANALEPSACWLVWDKNNGGSDQMDAELAWTNLKGVTRMFTKASEKTNRVHPTQKPVSLTQWILSRFMDDVDIVADPFGGSGSCLMACEIESKRCFTIEYTSDYCDVIIQRWENATGQKAVLSEG
jgi:site-specific DNA-methyltransferase (adenine-specific)